MTGVQYGEGLEGPGGGGKVGKGLRKISVLRNDHVGT